MALTTNKFVIPNGSPSGGDQPMQSSTYGPDDIDRAIGGIGWAYYVGTDYTSGSPLDLNAGNSYLSSVDINGLGTGSTTAQWPGGVTQPWNTSTNKLIGINDGDMLDMRLGFKAQDGASDVLLDVYVDIGGAIGPIWQTSVNIAKGASVETDVVLSIPYFTGSTFVTNGGTIYVSTADSSDDLSLWDFELLIFRKFVGL